MVILSGNNYFGLTTAYRFMFVLKISLAKVCLKIVFARLQPSQGCLFQPFPAFP